MKNKPKKKYRMVSPAVCFAEALAGELVEIDDLGTSSVSVVKIFGWRSIST